MTNNVIALLCGIGFITSLNLVATLALTRRLLGKTEEQRNEEKAQAAMDEAANADAERERNGSFDEGFENIMRFAVNGKTGFEGND